MASFVTLEREEYDDLIRDAERLAEAITTLDLILDAMKDRAIAFSGKVSLGEYGDWSELLNIIKYRMPAEFREFEKQVIAEDEEFFKNVEHRCDD